MKKLVMILAIVVAALALPGATEDACKAECAAKGCGYALFKWTCICQCADGGK